MDWAKRISFLELAYHRFNQRKTDELLAMMTDDVRWPDVANGTVLEGKAAILPYWEAQFAAADSRVIPVDFFPVGGDLVAIVKQRTFDHHGEVLAPPSIVFHRYTFKSDLVSRMVVFADRESATGR